MEDTNSTQICHKPFVLDEADFPDNSTSLSDPSRMPHSYTDNQINNKHGQSPKLPQGIRDIQHNITNVLFTGRLPTARKNIYDSQEMLAEKSLPEREPVELPKEPTEIFEEEETENAQPGCGGCMANLVVDLLIYLTRVLNTRTQAYRSIIIQLKKDRQECRQGMPVVAPRRFALEIKREALKQSLAPNNKASGNSSSREDVGVDCHKEDENLVKFVSPDDFDKDEHYLQR